MALSAVKDFLSSEKFWLPSNVSWSDFEDDKIHIPKVRQLWMWFPVAMFFIIIRFLWERYVAFPFGRKRGVSERKLRQPRKNAVLEAAFKKHKGHFPGGQDILVAWSKQLDMPIRRIERWWRLRKVCAKPTEMQRLGETSFRAVAYFFIFGYGIYTIWGKPYVWDTRFCWIGYPKHDITSEYFWYNCLEAGFYLSLLFSAAYDNRRKDFMEMMLHHFVSLSMLLFAWFINFVRVCVLMCVLHDLADTFLDAAKVSKYLKYKTLSDVFFVMFAVTWLVTRLTLLPLWVGWTSFFEGHYIIGLFPGYCLMAALYMVLQILHFYWFGFILQAIYRHVILKKELRDERSDSEPESETEDDFAGGDYPRKIMANGHCNGTVIQKLKAEINNNMGIMHV